MLGVEHASDFWARLNSWNEEGRAGVHAGGLWVGHGEWNDAGRAGVQDTGHAGSHCARLDKWHDAGRAVIQAAGNLLTGQGGWDDRADPLHMLMSMLATSGQGWMVGVMTLMYFFSL